MAGNALSQVHTEPEFLKLWDSWNSNLEKLGGKKKQLTFKINFFTTNKYDCKACIYLLLLPIAAHAPEQESQCLAR